MKNKSVSPFVIRLISFSFVLFVLLTLGFGESAEADVNFPWSTTYNCNEWTQSDWLDYYIPPNCDGISGGGDWVSSRGSETQITGAANNPAGGGKGQRNWHGHGSNDNSGSLSVSTPPYTELWIRWYMRYELGFSWNPMQGHKMLYLTPASGSSISTQPYMGAQGWHKMSFRIYTGPDMSWIEVNNFGWDDIMVNGPDDGRGHKAGDGEWHCYEVHLKVDTGTNRDGVAQMWVDGVLRVDNQAMSWGYHGDEFSSMLLGSNMSGVYAPAKDWYVDYDDIAISNTGYIGPINSPDTTPPSRSNFQPIGTLSSGTTSTIISLDTDETAICKYSANAETNYDLMENTFTNTNSTSHSQAIIGLSDGETKTYYIRCQDESTNQNTNDFEISFSIASSQTYSISNFINLVTDWLKSESGLESDVNGDGIVNTRDLGIMMSNWQ